MKSAESQGASGRCSNVVNAPFAEQIAADLATMRLEWLANENPRALRLHLLDILHALDSKPFE